MSANCQGNLELDTGIDQASAVQPSASSGCLRSIAQRLHGKSITNIPPDHLEALLGFTIEGGGDPSELVEMYGETILACTRRGCTAQTLALVLADEYLQTDWVHAGFSYLDECVSDQSL